MNRWDTLTLKNPPGGGPDVTLVHEDLYDEALGEATDLDDQLERMQDGGACDACLTAAYDAVDNLDIALGEATRLADQVEQRDRIIAGGTVFDGLYQPRMLGLTRADVAYLKQRVEAWRNDSKVWEWRARKAERERDENRNARAEALKWAAKEVHRKRLWGQDSPELADLDELFMQQAKEATD